LRFSELMRKVKKYIYKLIIALCILAVGQTALAYETVALNYPPNMGWHRTNYLVGKNEVIAQYTPAGQEAANYQESVVYHSYKTKNLNGLNATNVLKKKLVQVINNSKGLRMTPLVSTSTNAVYHWCADDVNGQGKQCEIVRVTASHEGFIMIHYINKNPADFKEKFKEWLERVEKAKTYYSYYRTDYVLNRQTYFEL